MKIAISFDFWNTLFADGDEPHRLTLRKKYFYKSIKDIVSVEQKEIDEAFESSMQYFLTAWKNDMRTPTAAERVRYMADMLNTRLSNAQVEDISDYFGRLIFDVPPREIKHLRQLLSEISSQFLLGIISDTGYISGKYIRRFLAQENLLVYFQSFMFSDENKHSKPHLTVFRQTAENLGVDLSHLIHIGDLERTDVAGALDAGCFAVKFTGANHRSSGGSVANRVIENYQMLPPILNDFVARGNQG